jgi:hypothetical protein
MIISIVEGETPTKSGLYHTKLEVELGRRGAGSTTDLPRWLVEKISCALGGSGEVAALGLGRGDSGWQIHLPNAWTGRLKVEFEVKVNARSWKEGDLPLRQSMLGAKPVVEEIDTAEDR